MSMGEAMRTSTRKRQRGNEVIEFAICSVVLVPLFFGTVMIGVRLGRSIQVQQVARDTAHMYARNVDFSTATSKDMLVRIASGLGMTPTGGNGVVILSTMMKVGDVQCANGGLSTSQCFNRGQTVIINRIVVGNSSLRASDLVTPTASLIQSNGDIAPAHYLTNPSTVAATFPSLLVLNDGEFAYVVEAYFESPDLDSLRYYTNNAVYARCIF